MCLFIHLFIYFFIIFRASWCTIHGTKYKNGAIVHTAADGILPKFAAIKKIVTVPDKTKNQIFFVMEEIITVNYNSHLHAYNVTTTGLRNTLVSKQFDLLTFRPMHLARCIGDNSSKYVCPKTDVDVYSEQV